MRITAVLCVRNEADYLDVTLSHLTAHGISLALIDHDSTDGTANILEKYRGHIVHQARLPYRGVFSLTEQLAAKQAVYDDVASDWFLHIDADEILQSPRFGESLRAGIERVAAAGWNVINFDEFVFVPNAPDEAFESRDFYTGMLHYYFFEPGPRRLMRAWQASLSPTQIGGGHQLIGSNLKVAPENFLLRHYPNLSLAHARRKYPTRVYAAEDVAKGWHVNRLNVAAETIALPTPCELKVLRTAGDKALDRTQPWTQHFWNRSLVRSRAAVQAG